MFTPHAGMSEFYIWNDDFQERTSLNKEYNEYVNKLIQLGKILKKDGKQPK